MQQYQRKKEKSAAAAAAAASTKMVLYFKQMQVESHSLISCCDKNQITVMSRTKSLRTRCNPGRLQTEQLRPPAEREIVPSGWSLMRCT